MAYSQSCSKKKKRQTYKDVLQKMKKINNQNGNQHKDVKKYMHIYYPCKMTVSIKYFASVSLEEMKRISTDSA